MGSIYPYLNYILTTPVWSPEEVVKSSLLKGKQLRDVVPEGRRYWKAHRILCADGNYISVQAGSTMHCMPTTNQGPWTEVECGFPSVRPHETMMKYAEDRDIPTGTIYNHVPVAEVEKFISAHGGEANDFPDHPDKAKEPKPPHPMNLFGEEI